MPWLIRLLAVLPMVVTMSAMAAPADKKPGTRPTPKIYPCAGQLTRTPDKVIAMGPNKTFYLVNDNVAPVTTPPVLDPGYPITQAAAKAKECKRRVIDVQVPSTTSSGCPRCYPNAEISVCAGQFAGSKLFEHHCRVPTSSTPEATCKKFSHAVEVYKKKSGDAEFDKTPLATYVWRGVVDASGCRVLAKVGGNSTYDTSEAYANVLPPASGTDVYRILSLPTYKGALVDTVVFVEFEER
jgi:hypothetical protein